MPSRDLLLLMLRLGFTAFGGPAAHLAMLQREVVEQRPWLTQDEFLDLLGATNLIPGPNSTEMMMHVGMKRAGRIGLWLAGLAFILPAALITLAFAWAYVAFGTLPAAHRLLFGVKPAVLAIIAAAVWKLGRGAMERLPLALLGLAVLVLYFWQGRELLLLLGSGVIGMALRQINHKDTKTQRDDGDASGEALAGVQTQSASGTPESITESGLRPHSGKWRSAVLIPTLIFTLCVFVSSWLSRLPGPATPIRVGVYFLKIGSVLFGSGYVLLAFLQQGIVQHHGWLTQQQLLDAVAVGQFTPGPVFSTATFIGYVIAGVPGAVAATIGIFLPAFLLVGATHSLVPKLRASPWAAGFLDGVNVGSVALMAGVCLQLAAGALTTWQPCLIAALALAVVLGTRVNAAWVILGGALLGMVGG